MITTTVRELRRLLEQVENQDATILFETRPSMTIKDGTPATGYQIHSQVEIEPQRGGNSVLLR